MPVKLPETKSYRVATLAVTYLSPVESFDANGGEIVAQVTKVGRFGEEIDLTVGEAKRIQVIGEGLVPPVELIKPAGAPLDYQEMTVPDLEALAEERGIEVSGTGANGGVLKEDLVNALNTYDRGQSGS